MDASTIQQGVLLLKHALKKIFVLIFFLAAIRSEAQNIDGVKIQVSADTAINLTFNSKVVSWEFDEESGLLTYDIGLADDYKMKIIATKATAEILHFNVTEGRRKHKFVLLYKEGVEGLVISHDYSDLKKLEKFIKNGSEDKPDEKLTALTTEADKAFQNGQYEQAIEKYKQALQADAENEHAKKQMDELEKKITEKKILAQKELDDKFSNTILKANSALLSKRYEEAIKEYEEALKIKPNDVYSKSQVQAIKKKMDDDTMAEATRKKDSLFNSYIATAQKAYYDKLYEAAVNAYNQALNIKPGDAIAITGLKEIDRAVILNKQQEQNKKIEVLYQSYIASADKAYLDKLYEEAKIAYTQALDTKLNDKYANDQLKKIDNELARIAQQKEQEQKDKAAESQYNAIINLADSAFNMELWDVAKEEYGKASQLINKPYPQQRIAEINKKLADFKNIQIAEKQKQVKDSLDNLKYNTLIEKADNDFEKKDYNNAKAVYKQVLAIKDDQYPKSKLSEIENILTEIAKQSQAEKDSIAKENEINKKYNILIAKARIAYTNSDYANARSAFEEASELKPNEEEPKTRLAEIDKKLADLAKAKDVRDKYDSITAKADLALGNHDYATALEGYKEALDIKPDEAYYLQKQINFLQTQLAMKDSTELEVKKGEDRRQKFNDGMNSYNNGRAALKELRYEDALSEFQKFLDLIPDTSQLNTYQYNQQELINFAKAKIQALKDYLARSKGKPL